MSKSSRVLQDLQQELDLRPMVFHVRPAEASVVERALRRFGGPRRRRGAALVAAIRAAGKTKKEGRK